MTRVLFNGSIQGFRGRIGNLIFRQLPDGTTIVTKAPPKESGRQKKRDKLKRSARQQAHNSRFQEAVAYGKQAAKVHPIYAELAAVTPMKTAYNFALSDWFNPPVIHRIERREGLILVQASDNVMVTKLCVTVLDEAGQALENGEATRTQGDCWEYVSNAEGKTIQAAAWDLAGNVTKMVQ
jgi:hypothetical protein